MVSRVRPLGNLFGTCIISKWDVEMCWVDQGTSADQGSETTTPQQGKALHLDNPWENFKLIWSSILALS